MQYVYLCTYVLIVYDDIIFTQAFFCLQYIYQFQLNLSNQYEQTIDYFCLILLFCLYYLWILFSPIWRSGRIFQKVQFGVCRQESLNYYFQQELFYISNNCYLKYQKGPKMPDQIFYHQSYNIVLHFRFGSLLCPL